ncbi:hypothetical protein [Microcoleus sp. T3_D1]|uniref:hypothetical protein n=1 Tax=Microcoleus sp. T3_D1 TaxID=3055427 RepID=UPI002FD1D66F
MAVASAAKIGTSPKLKPLSFPCSSCEMLWAVSDLLKGLLSDRASGNNFACTAVGINGVTSL